MFRKSWSKHWLRTAPPFIASRLACALPWMQPRSVQWLKRFGQRTAMSLVSLQPRARWRSCSSSWWAERTKHEGQDHCVEHVRRFPAEQAHHPVLQPVSVHRAADDDATDGFQGDDDRFEC